MSNLQTALAHAEKIENMLIESGGEITPEIESEMAVNPQTISQLVDVKFVSLERLEKAQEFFAEKAESFQKIAKSLKAAESYIKDSVKNYMRESGKTELAGEEYQFKLSNSASKVKIVDENKIDKAYYREKTEIVLDTKKIGEDLKTGIPVDGCILEEVYSLRKSILKGKKNE